MPLYRKKPVVIEAFQFFYANSEKTIAYPIWFVDAILDGTVFESSSSPENYIKTLEGTMHIGDGDFVIRGVKGEIYACKPDIFAETYEEAV